MFSLRSCLFLALSLSLLAGCPSASSCPSGTEAVGTECVPVDAPPTDAGPKGDGEMPFADVPLPDDGGAPPDVPGLDAPTDACAIVTFYQDMDGDMVGSDVEMTGCVAPAGFVATSGDCDDENDEVYPGAAEICEMAMIDEDCDATANEGCECWIGQARACPGASDVGECIAGTQLCGPDGRWLVSCEGTVGPVTELCDTRDNDCDGTSDGDAADASCPAVVNGRGDCASGACQAVCNSGYADCGAGAGCETTLGTTAACTACGARCSWSCRSAATGCNDPAAMTLGNTILGASSNCAVRSDGTLHCWGDNASGELGHGSTGTDTARPTPVVGLPTGRVLSAAIGLSHGCAVVASGSASAGAVHCWGSNSDGQLGNGGTTDSETPVAVTGVTSAVEVGVGTAFSCARLSSGGVRCWGRNTAGQVGVDDVIDHPSAVSVLGVSGSLELAVGHDSACVRQGALGEVLCWGDGYTGREQMIEGLASAIAVGADHACAVTNDLVSGSYVECWGDNGSGQLGNGSTTSSATAVRARTFSATIVPRTIAAGTLHTCALTTSGAVYCWGDNAYGQLGLSGADRTSPVLVSSIGTATEIAAGALDTCALTVPSGFIGTQMSCWGEGSSGELGNGFLTDSSSPVVVSAP